MPSSFVSLTTRMSTFLATRNFKESNLFRIEFILRCAIIKPLGLFFRSFPSTFGLSSVFSYIFLLVG